MSSSSALIPFWKYEYYLEEKRDATLIIDQEANINVLTQVLTCDIPLCYTISHYVEYLYIPTAVCFFVQMSVNLKMA
jgi:hypothetical protein